MNWEGGGEVAVYERGVALDVSTMIDEGGVRLIDRGGGCGD
jgi:hypothetical protein